MIKRFKFKKNQTLVGYIFNEIDTYTKDVMLNEFKDIFKGEPVGIYSSNSLSHFMWQELFPKGRVNKKHLIQSAKEISQLDERIPMSVFHLMEDVNGVAKISDIWIRIMSETVFYDILANLENIDAIIEQLKMDMRHEIGHVIDCFKLEGMPFDEYVELMEADKDAVNAFYDKWGHDTSELSVEENHQRLREYYECPAEARANAHVNFDIDRYLEIKDILSYERKDFQIDMTIKSTVKTFIDEDKEEDKNAN